MKFGLIGGGVMGEALLSRLLAADVYKSEEIIVSEPAIARRNFLAEKYRVNTTADNHQVFKSVSEVIFLAVKPQVFNQIAADFAAIGELQSSPMVVSILAGVTLGQLESAFTNLPVIRAMPNTPATVGAGMTAICGGSKVKPEQLKLAQQLFTVVGEVVDLPESMMDAVTGLSGSGPAYIAILVEALADGGVASGLPRAIANQLALQTVLGTAQLLAETKLHPAVLKDQVTSPGGTTIAGITALEAGGFRAAIINAVQRATLRSRELGEKA
ncbi:pyrroline-5-carboxylate reductase [Calothrix sp. NIES-3974]|nr:pyrroline-5-carboxylate reductase [Calothrix sp. NIES-3974]